MQAREPARPVAVRREAEPEGREEAPAAAAPAPPDEADVLRSEGAGTVMVEVPAAWDRVVGALTAADEAAEDAAEDAAEVELDAL